MVSAVLFLSFGQCQLFACLSRAAIFLLLLAFVVWSLALVSGYQCNSQFLVSCCALAARQLHPWRFELEFFPSRLPCGQLYKFRFEAKTFGIAP